MKMFLCFLVLLVSTHSFAKGASYTCNFSKDLGDVTLEGQLEIVELSELENGKTSYYANYWFMDINSSTLTNDVISYSFENESSDLSALLADDNFDAFLGHINVDAKTIKSVRIFEVEPSDDGSSFAYYALNTSTETKYFVQIGWGIVVRCE